jgi:hypothetical protein
MLCGFARISASRKKSGECRPITVMMPPREGLFEPAFCVLRVNNVISTPSMRSRHVEVWGCFVSDLPPFPGAGSRVWERGVLPSGLEDMNRNFKRGGVLREAVRLGR